MIKTRFISWNVNGLRACMQKGFIEFAQQQKADFICLQETKMQEGQAEIPLDGYKKFFNSAEKKGYSGTAVFTKLEPLSVVNNGMEMEEHSHEGRMITVDMGNFYLVNVYTPNSKDGLLRIDYRMQWEDDLRGYLMKLDSEKPVIYCGDLNVAHNEIDLKREKISTLLNSGFVDTFRYLYPNVKEKYSWWSYRFNARKNNAGWRIDYFIVSDRIKDKIKEADMTYDPIMDNDNEFVRGGAQTNSDNANKLFAHMILTGETNNKRLSLANLIDRGLKSAPMGAMNLSKKEMSELRKYIEENF